MLSPSDWKHSGDYTYIAIKAVADNIFKCKEEIHHIRRHPYGDEFYPDAIANYEFSDHIADFHRLKHICPFIANYLPESIKRAKI
jgi:hypothetical protein